MFGNVPAGVMLSEFIVMSVATRLMPPGTIMFGVAEALRTIHGLKSATPMTESQPAVPGPALQPHQLFSAVAVPSTRFKPAVVFPTMRLKLRLARPWLWTRTPVALPTMVLLVTSTGWLPEKFEPASHWKPIFAPETRLFV